MAPAQVALAQAVSVAALAQVALAQVEETAETAIDIKEGLEAPLLFLAPFSAFLQSIQLSVVGLSPY